MDSSMSASPYAGLNQSQFGGASSSGNVTQAQFTGASGTTNSLGGTSGGTPAAIGA